MSGAEIARVVLRTTVGATMIAHGMRHAKTLEGTARWFGSIGFKQPKLQAQASAAVEIGAGAALVVGAATPLAASAVVGTMAVAARTVHAPNGFFVIDEGWEYAATLAAASVAISALGPGRFSLDRLVEKVAPNQPQPTPFQRAALTAGLGIGAAAAQLAVFWRRPAGT
jgi:putative oxidoreductase